MRKQMYFAPMALEVPILRWVYYQYLNCPTQGQWYEEDILSNSWCVKIILECCFDANPVWTEVDSLFCQSVHCSVVSTSADPPLLAQAKKSSRRRLISTFQQHVFTTLYITQCISITSSLFNFCLMLNPILVTITLISHNGQFFTFCFLHFYLLSL